MRIQHPKWWHGAIIYQIYPRSFFDSNHDGIGDLQGITEKLPYIADLGVDAIWISPFLKSPQEDFGYDVSDYYEIDPLFGSLADFDALVQKAHALKLRVLMDMVLNHTSAQHPWFIESRKDRSNPKANWYVWASPKPDGSPPNNWLSVFGGEAWEWDSVRQQYYFHNFLSSQPDLNFHHPEVLEAMLKVGQFWLSRGVDGFRLDTANYYIHDKDLRDNLLRADHEPSSEGVPPDNPYGRQYHLYDKSRPENFFVLKQIRKLMDCYPDTVTIGEVADDHCLVTAANYVKGQEHLHMVYNFRLLDASSNFSAKFIYDCILELEKHLEDGWPCWSFSNHDVQRVATRFSHGKPTDTLSKLLLALLFSLRGTICLYQGEELGLVEAEVPFEKMQDPYGLRFYPVFKGRDGCRTPMPWTKEGGFSNAAPWLPLYLPHLMQSVSIQEHHPDSVLQFCKQFLRWRKSQAALLYGDIHDLRFEGNILMFERNHESQQIALAFNLGEEEKRIEQKGDVKILKGHEFLFKCTSKSSLLGLIKHA